MNIDKPLPSSASIVPVFGPLTIIWLNRPQIINSINLEMVMGMRAALDQAKELPECRAVLLAGIGERGFCAGGDIKAMWNLAGQGRYDEVERFFREEYALDLLTHDFPKPILILAEGTTLGGGLGLASGADFVIATENTMMAMPETRIGFIPDVGASGWLHAKCPPGYPAFLGLTGYSLRGQETVRLGLATHGINLSARTRLIAELERLMPTLPRNKDNACVAIDLLLTSLQAPIPEPAHAMDAWVAQHFAIDLPLLQLIENLKCCTWGTEFCAEFLQNLEHQSPTALVYTHALLHDNQGLAPKQVYENEFKAAAYLIRQPDFFEGVRAVMIDKDNTPHWNPPTLQAVVPNFTWRT